MFLRSVLDDSMPQWSADWSSWDYDYDYDYNDHYGNYASGTFEPGAVSLGEDHAPSEYGEFISYEGHFPVARCLEGDLSCCKLANSLIKLKGDWNLDLGRYQPPKNEHLNIPPRWYQGVLTTIDLIWRLWGCEFIVWYSSAPPVSSEPHSLWLTSQATGPNNLTNPVRTSIRSPGAGVARCFHEIHLVIHFFWAKWWFVTVKPTSVGCYLWTHPFWQWEIGHRPGNAQVQIGQKVRRSFRSKAAFVGSSRV